jgi:predicted metal-dependent hydrolase
MEPIITYKSVRNGYARINKDGMLEITIPKFLKNDKKFEENLVQRGQKLWKHYHTKEKIQTANEGVTTLFGEPISISEVTAKPSKLKEELKTILAEYARPLMDHYSALLGKSYKELSIRKTSSKR